jgi:hypothetical protein
MRDLGPIRETIKKVVGVLKLSSADRWTSYFQGVYEDSFAIGNDDELKHWVRKITGVYGGMGSFQDLVLHDEGNPLKQENNILYDLKDKLGDQAMELIEVKSE